MYSLGDKKAQKFKENLENGEIFLKYDKKSDKVWYLSNLTKKKAKTQDLKTSTSLTSSVTDISKLSSVSTSRMSLLTSALKRQDIKGLECLVKLKLNEDVKQQATDEDKIKLNFQSVDCQF